jgi:hypothetical protein
MDFLEQVTPRLACLSSQDRLSMPGKNGSSSSKKNMFKKKDKLAISIKSFDSREAEPIVRHGGEEREVMDDE